MNFLDLSDWRTWVILFCSHAIMFWVGAIRGVTMAKESYRRYERTRR